MASRLIGVDLAITGKHRASVMEAEGTFVGKSFSFDRTFDGFNFLLKRSIPQKNPHCHLTFILEPTSKAWIALGSFLIARGHKVFLVAPQKVADLRKYYKKYTKSDRIDSRVLAKLPIVDSENLNELYLPEPIIAALKGYCKQRAKIVDSICARKTRIQAMFTSVSPKLMEAFGEDKFTQVSRAFLRKYVNPFKIKQLGLARLSNFLKNNSFGEVDIELAQKIFSASIDAVKIYQKAKDKGILPFDYEQIQDELNIELDLMEFEEKKLNLLDKKISLLYYKIDPEGVLKSSKGMGDVNAPTVLGITGNISRFHNVRSYQCFCGLVPKKKQTSEHDKKGLPVRKNAQRLLKKSYYLAAETARKWDVEYAAFYNRLIKKGLHHNQAMCALARKCAARSYALMKRMHESRNSLTSEENISYKLRDLNGNTINSKQARDIILAKYPSKNSLQKEKERIPLQLNLSRQSLNSSKMKVGDPPLISDILDDILSEETLQAKN